LGEGQQLRLERAGPDAGEAEYVTAGEVVREVGRKLGCEPDWAGVKEGLRSRIGLSGGG
jgi:hypothetical protein